MTFRPFNDGDYWSEFEKLFNIAKTKESLALLFDPLLSYQIVPVVDHALSVLARNVANMVPTLGPEVWDEVFK